ncbi:MAG: hypothetical protein ACFHWZ_18450 [Phycisphaerales bacterium]
MDEQEQRRARGKRRTQRAEGVPRLVDQVFAVVLPGEPRRDDEDRTDQDGPPRRGEFEDRFAITQKEPREQRDFHICASPASEGLRFHVSRRIAPTSGLSR